MATFSSAMLMATALLSLLLVASATARTDEEVMGLYLRWQAQHGKAQNGLPNNGERFEIFKDNLKFIDEHNSMDRPYKVGLNRFADLTNEEYRAMFLGTRPTPEKVVLGQSKPSLRYWPRRGDRIPKAVDWRNLGAVNQVKDQGQCGNSLSLSRNIHHQNS